MLGDQFHQAAEAARTTAALDNVARLLWRAHGEGHIDDADAEALSEAIEARRAILVGNAPGAQTAAPEAPRASRRASRARRRREKMFGMGRPHGLDRNAKVRIMHWARCLSRRTEPGKAYR